MRPLRLLSGWYRVSTKENAMSRTPFGNAFAHCVAAGVAAALAFVVTPAQATPFVVDSVANSSTAGVGLTTIFLSAGETFSTTASSDDLWSAGALPRWSDAGGLTGNRFATGVDESGAPTGTLIGMNFGLWTQHALSAPYGSVVGEINGVFKELGLSYSGTAWSTGTLSLYYWDSNTGDNSGQVTVDVTAGPAHVPEPASIAILGMGLLGVAASRRRRKIRS
jgi:hypothetical protein